MFSEQLGTPKEMRAHACFIELAIVFGLIVQGDEYINQYLQYISKVPDEGPRILQVDVSNVLGRRESFIEEWHSSLILKHVEAGKAFTQKEQNMQRQKFKDHVFGEW